MKNLLILLLSFQCLSQELDTVYFLPELTTDTLFMEKVGSCASPDGPMQVTPSPPPNYAYLNNNGYCYPGIASTNDVTMCFTFTPTTPNVNLNGGYSESCANNNFTAFNLYNSACVLVYSGLSPTGLIVGNTYTWCVTMKAWGGPSCNGYTTFCPYWIPISNLPIELVSFESDCRNLNWRTISEIDCDYYTVEGSIDGKEWRIVGKINCNNSTSSNYYTLDISLLNLEYYRLTQYDINGAYEVFDIISSNCDFETPAVVEVYNYNGKYLGDTTPIKPGIYIVKYNTGVVKRVFVR